MVWMGAEPLRGKSVDVGPHHRTLMDTTDDDGVAAAADEARSPRRLPAAAVVADAPLPAAAVAKCRRRCRCPRTRRKNTMIRTRGR